MNLFFDTSALVKFFIEEQGTEKVESLVLDKNNNLYIFELAEVEFYSALYKRLRMNELTHDDLELIFKEFKRDLSKFQMETFAPSIKEEAIEIIKRIGSTKMNVRTLDVLHLSCFNVIRGGPSHLIKRLQL